MGYHVRDIKKGVVGDSSKIREELDEFLDAESQNNPVMALIELSDIIGAIDCYLLKKHPTITLKDLIVMAHATSKAFADGSRK